MSDKTKVLVVEDDTNLGTILNEYLNAKGYDTMLATDGEKGFESFTNQPFDFVILDVMMPKKDGFTLAKDIRNINTDVPILFLTAKSMKEDTIEGFRIGADDYMTKPFSMEELLARMKAILKRSGASQSETENLKEFKLGKLTFNTTKRLLISDNNEQKLTSKESELLRLLCLNQNNVLDRTVALKSIWNDDSYFNSRSMDVYITKLRKYLKDDPSIEIMNIHGQGFRLVVN